MSQVIKEQKSTKSTVNQEFEDCTKTQKLLGKAGQEYQKTQKAVNGT